MPDIFYRPFKADDANEVYETAMQAWQWAYQDIFNPSFIRNFVNTNYAPERLIGLVPLLQSGQTFFHVAECDAQIVGYCHISLTDNNAELLRIYLRPKFIGQGIGSRLLQEGEKFLEAQHVFTYFCYVHQKNELGKQFYQRVGFRHIVEQDQNDEWYMEKTLE